MEGFTGLEPIHSHTGARLADCVMNMIEGFGFDQANSSGLSYDKVACSVSTTGFTLI